MFRRILNSALLIFFSVSLLSASETYLIDTPTASVLDYGSYSAGFRVFSNGNLLSKIDFGVFKLLNIGVSWELDKFVGNDRIKAAIPALRIKFKIYDGDMTLPEVAVGYDGQGYFFDFNREGNYLQMGKGLYIVAGRELLIEGLTLNAGINMSSFSKPRIHGFLNLITSLYKDIIYFMMECDSMDLKLNFGFNFGFNFALTEHISARCVLRRSYCDCDRQKNCYKKVFGRVFEISYSGKF